MRTTGLKIDSTMPRFIAHEIRATPRIKRGPCHHGFSLAEMVMVITIISIAAAIAVPRFSRSVARRQADAAAQRVSQDMSLARHHARISSSDIKVEFRTAPGYLINGLPDPNSPSRDYTVDMQSAPYHVSQWEVDFDGFKDVTFNMYERPDRGGDIVLRVGDEIRTIAINGDTGRSQIVDDDAPVTNNAIELSQGVSR